MEIERNVTFDSVVSVMTGAVIAIFSPDSGLPFDSFSGLPNTPMYFASVRKGSDWFEPYAAPAENAAFLSILLPSPYESLHRVNVDQLAILIRRLPLPFQSFDSVSFRRE
jgi:hypothetical protein